MMFVVAGRQSASARTKPATERVSGDVQSAGVEAEADGGRRVDAKLSLSVDRVRPRDDRGVRLPSGLSNGCDQRNQFVAEWFESCLNARCGRAGFVVFEQRVVRLAIAVAERLGFFAFQAERPCEPRFER